MSNCACGCGKKVTEYKYAQRKYISGHNSKVNHPLDKGARFYKNICKICKKEFLDNKSNKRKFCSRKCYNKFRSQYYRWDKHPMWKGNNIKNIIWLHQVIRNNWKQPELCECCKKIPPYDLANKTGIYNKEKENWLWLCRKCHYILDISKHPRDLKTGRLI